MKKQIPKGSYVRYDEGRGIMINKKREYRMVSIYGIWDGEKVEFNDKGKTIVRNKDYLTIVSAQEYLSHNHTKFDINDINIT